MDLRILRVRVYYAHPRVSFDHRDPLSSFLSASCLNRCCCDLQINGWVTILVRYNRTQRRREIQDPRHQRPGRAVEFSLLSKNCLCTSMAIRIRLESGLKTRGFRIVTQALSYTHITFFCKTPSNKSCHQQARFLPTRSRHFSSPNLEAGFCGWHRGTGTVERHRPSRPQYA